MAGPSPHLSWAELGCKDGTPYPDTWRGNRAIRLAVEFERIRTHVGAPIVVGSAYRTPAHNAAIGGAVRSQHVEGRALDLYPPAGWTMDWFFAVIRSIALRDDSGISASAGIPRSCISTCGRRIRVISWSCGAGRGRGQR